MRRTPSALVHDDSGARACGIWIAASVGTDRFELSIPGELGVARTVDGRIFNWVCGMKPVTSMAVAGALTPRELSLPGRAGIPPLRILAHQYSGTRSLSALEFLNASDEQRHAHHGEVLRSRVDEELASTFHEVSMLMLAENELDTELGLAVQNLCSATGMHETFVGPVTLAPENVGCLIEYRRRSQAIPLMHDRSDDFLQSRWLQYVGGYSSVSDIAKFYRKLLEVYGGNSIHGFPPSDIIRSELDSVPTGQSFRLGMMVNLDAWGIKPSACRSFGHIGFMRSSIAYVEPDTGFVFAGVRRAVEFEEQDHLPSRWTELISRVRQELGV